MALFTTSFKKLATLLVLAEVIAFEPIMAAPAMHPPNGILFSDETHSEVTISSISLHPRFANPTTDPGIFFCDRVDGNGTCFYVTVPPSRYGDCGMVTDLKGWDSVEPDKGIMVSLYADTACAHFIKENIIHPGSGNLQADGINGTSSESIGLRVVAYDGVYRTNATGT